MKAIGIEKNTFTLTGLVADVDGTQVIKGEKSGPVGSAETVGVHLAEALLDRGASKILEKLKLMATENNEI